MSPTKPVIGIPADRRMIEPHFFHAVGEKYITAVTAIAGGVPMLIPAAGAELDPPHVLEVLDGLVVPGSPSNVEPHHYDGPVSEEGTWHDPHRDATTLPLIRAAVGADVPLLAICRGFQELNVAMGGTLYQKLHEVEGHEDHREDGSEDVELQYGEAHAILLHDGGMLRRLMGSEHAVVNSLHGQGVERLGTGLVVEATAPDGVIEAARVEHARFVLGVQWHPEWRATENPLSRVIFEAFGLAARERAAGR